MSRPAVFVDRDGTLIEEVNFLSRVEDLRVFPFTPPAIKLLKDNGFLVIVLTNQSGIARGKYSEADMHAIHDQIQARSRRRHRRILFLPASCRVRNAIAASQISA